MDPAQTHDSATAGTLYTCPMHPEVRSDRRGACPKCGMALEPLLGAGSGWPGAVARTEWTCPMHSQIVRDSPGSCPICGMALEPRTVTAAFGILLSPMIAAAAMSFSSVSVIANSLRLRG